MNTATKNDISQLMSNSVIGSTFYLDLPISESAQLELIDMKISALECLSRTIDETNAIFSQRLLLDYSAVLGEKTAVIESNINQNLGNEVISVLSEPCWQIGYDPTLCKIFFKKVCPMNKPTVTMKEDGKNEC